MEEEGEKIDVSTVDVDGSHILEAAVKLTPCLDVTPGFNSCI